MHGFCSPQKLQCASGRSPGFEAAPECRRRASSFPGLTAEWICGGSSSFAVAGPRRNCTGLPFSALAGVLSLKQLYHASGEPTETPAACLGFLGRDLGRPEADLRESPVAHPIAGLDSAAYSGRSGLAVAGLPAFANWSLARAVW